jgi:hypothetical protein
MQLNPGHTVARGARSIAANLALVSLLVGAGRAFGQELERRARRQDLAGLVDPRFKLSVGLVGAPALTLAQFGSAPRRTAIGAGVTVVPMGHLRCATILIVGQQSIKFAYSTGTTTRRGSDFNTFNATWQLVMF